MKLTHVSFGSICGLPKMLSGSLLDQNSFHNNIISLFFPHFLTGVQWTFGGSYMTCDVTIIALTANWMRACWYAPVFLNCLSSFLIRQILVDLTHINKSSLRSSTIFQGVKGSWDQKFWELLPCRILTNFASISYFIEHSSLGCVLVCVNWF